MKHVSLVFAGVAPPQPFPAQLGAPSTGPCPRGWGRTPPELPPPEAESGPELPELSCLTPHCSPYPIIVFPFLTMDGGVGTHSRTCLSSGWKHTQNKLNVCLRDKLQSEQGDEPSAFHLQMQLGVPRCFVYCDGDLHVGVVLENSEAKGGISLFCHFPS